MEFEYKLEKLLTKVNNKTKINNYVFLSLGAPNIKAQVKLFKKTNYLKQSISKLALKFKTSSPDSCSAWFVSSKRSSSEFKLVL